MRVGLEHLGPQKCSLHLFVNYGVILSQLNIIIDSSMTAMAVVFVPNIVTAVT